MNRADLLTAALDAVNARPKAYGPPERNFDRIARLWSAHTVNRYGEGVGLRFDSVDVALMMDLMKTARLEETPGHMDSWVDKAGYSACGAECATTIEHDPEEVAAEPSPPAPLFKVGDKVRIKTDDSREVCEIGAVDVTSGESRRYGLFFEGFPRESPIMAWSDDELEPAGPRFKPGDEVAVADMSGRFFVHRISSVGTYSISDQYGSIFHDYPEGELTPA